MQMRHRLRSGSGVKTLMLQTLMLLFGPETCGTNVEGSITRWATYSVLGFEWRGVARTVSSLCLLIRGWSGSDGIMEVSMENVRSWRFFTTASHHRSSTSSTGKYPTSAPYSVVILAIMRRSSTGRMAMPSPQWVRGCARRIDVEWVGGCDQVGSIYK
jgi:hypothetical protein